MAIPLKVTIYKGSDLIGEQRFDRDIVKIGRLASAHLRLDDAKVSRIHAVIEVSSDGAGFSIIDMGSSDGTFVNGERVSKEKLRDGDEIRVGDSRLVISLDNASERPHADAEATAADLPSFRPSAGAPQGPVTEQQVAWTPQAQQADWAQAAATMQMAAASPLGGQPPPAPRPSDASMDPQLNMATQVPQQQAQAAAMAAAAQQQAIMQAQMQAAAMQAAQAAQAAQYAAYGMQVPGMQMPAGADEAQVQQQWAAQMQFQQAMAGPQGAWGAVPNNLASEGVPEDERALEIKAIWGDTILDTINVTNKPVITMGDEPKTTGFGPWQKFVRCDSDLPTKGLPERSFPLAVSTSPDGCAYSIHVHATFGGYLERADGTVTQLEELVNSGRGVEQGDYADTWKYNLKAEETLYLRHDTVTLQLRYVRKTPYVPAGLFKDLNYTWVNILILAFFFHVLAVASFVSVPKTVEELTETLFKNPNRFAQFRLTPEKKLKQQTDFLAKLKAGAPGAKARGAEGKAGKKDYDKNKPQGRMAVKGNPDDKEIAKSSLAKLFGGQGNVGRSYLFGTGGLGGELKGALGGVTGAQIGDASGLGGLGTRGTGPGGGGLSMNSVGLGALGTAGRGGGGDGGYGNGVGNLGKKAERDISISAGSPIIMGSLDKELIRRVIEEHKAQIRYCYEKELIRSPGLFGKINIQWTISAQGSVSDSKVKESTMQNAGVETCIAGKIRTWMFPKPKGGGVVIVNYPFVFKQTG